MSEKKKELLDKIEEVLPIISPEKQQYFAGYADGVKDENARQNEKEVEE